MAHSLSGSFLRSSGVCSTSYTVETSLTLRHQPYFTSCVSLTRRHQTHQCCNRSLTSLATTNTFGRLVRGQTRPLHFSCRGRFIVQCSKHDSRSSKNRRPRRGWPPWDWMQRLPSLPRILFNVVAFFLLMRIWPLQGKSPLGEAQTLNIQVPFSTFLHQTNGRQVSAVTVDGTTLKYTLREGAALLQNLPESAQSAKIAFQTIRPTDYAMPYDQLMKHGTQFAAAETKNSWILTSMVYVLYTGLLLSALNKLPLKLPQKTAGRRHQQKAHNSVPVCFDDVCGVDEAKEELAEIVASSHIMWHAFAAVKLESASSLRKLGCKACPSLIHLRNPQAVESRMQHNSADTAVLYSYGELAAMFHIRDKELLRSPDKFSRLGARAPSGVLLVGPPGTGKTLLAKAVAGEADVPFISISASEFVELYVGMGAMRVRQLFAQARKAAPSIVFIDEIDAVAKGRDTRMRSVGQGNDEREQTLNQLLTELDGFESDKDKMVICIAATNRADVLDPALLRPGRFDRRVAVERPDRIGRQETLSWHVRGQSLSSGDDVTVESNGSSYLGLPQSRQEILSRHMKRQGLPLGDDVTVESIAGSTTGFTGADLANLVNEAALLAGRSDKGTVGQTDFDQAILRAVAGVEKKRSILQGAEKESVAKHECGHALVGTAIASLIPTFNQVEKLSIIPRSGGALGFTYSPPKSEDKALMFDNEMRGQLAVLMGGRAAEALTCNFISNGASDDIRRATELAYRSVSEFGLSAAVGPLAVASMGGDDGSLMLRDSGGIVARQVEQEVKRLVDTALTVAKSVITANMALHTAMSNQLQAAERLEGESLQEHLQNIVIPDDLRSFVQGL